MPTGVEQFVTRMIATKVASPDEIRGCSPEELAVFERDYDLRLPESYRAFLARAGHSAGKLFAWDHVDAYYPAVMSMLDDSRRALDEPSEVDDEDEESVLRTVSLPDKALVILGRLDEQFHFIVCEGGDDTPVFYFSEEGEPPKRSYDSVLDWLEDWRSGAEEAIRNGHFA